MLFIDVNNLGLESQNVALTKECRHYVFFNLQRMNAYSRTYNEKECCFMQFDQKCFSQIKKERYKTL